MVNWKNKYLKYKLKLEKMNSKNKQNGGSFTPLATDLVSASLGAYPTSYTFNPVNSTELLNVANPFSDKLDYKDWSKLSCNAKIELQQYTYNTFKNDILDRLNDLISKNKTWEDDWEFKLTGLYPGDMLVRAGAFGETFAPEGHTFYHWALYIGNGTVIELPPSSSTTYCKFVHNADPINFMEIGFTTLTDFITAREPYEGRIFTVSMDDGKRISNNDIKYTLNQISNVLKYPFTWQIGILRNCEALVHFLRTGKWTTYQGMYYLKEILPGQILYVTTGSLGVLGLGKGIKFVRSRMNQSGEEEVEMIKLTKGKTLKYFNGKFTSNESKDSGIYCPCKDTYVMDYNRMNIPYGSSKCIVDENECKQKNRFEQKEGLTGKYRVGKYVRKGRGSLKNKKWQIKFDEE